MEEGRKDEKRRGVKVEIYRMTGKGKIEDENGTREK